MPQPMWRRRAQALAELAIVLPVLLILIFGLVSVGQILLANHTISQAARAAAHQAAINGGDAEPAYSAAEQVIDSGVGTDYASARVSVACASPCRRYAAVTVSIIYQGRLWAPVPPFDQFTVRAAATRAAERDQQR